MYKRQIHTITIDPATGLMPHHGRAVAKALDLSGDLAKQAAKILEGLYAAVSYTHLDVYKRQSLLSVSSSSRVSVAASIAMRL